MKISPRMCGAVAALAAALAVPPGAMAQSDCGASYTVQSGDTLAAIAGRCGTTVDALVGANPVITDPARITVGWELTIPGGRASLGPGSDVRERALGEDAEAALAQGSYEVQPGDSFASIATALQIPMRELMAANEGVDPFALRPGQALRLPGDAGAAADVEATGPAQEAAVEPLPVTADRPDAADAAEKPDEEPDEKPDGEPNERAASPAPGPEEPPAERLVLEGRIQSGPECPVLETPEGEVYSLVSAEFAFMPGEYVEIEGETVEMSFCMEGQATVRVTSMNAVPAQGG